MEEQDNTPQLSQDSNSLDNLDLNSLGDDCDSSIPIPSEINPIPKFQEPIQSQEILLIETPEGFKIHLASQILTPKGLMPIALNLFNQLKNKGSVQKSMVGVQ